MGSFFISIFLGENYAHGLIDYSFIILSRGHTKAHGFFILWPLQTHPAVFSFVQAGV